MNMSDGNSQKNGMTRRDFLKSAAAGAAGIAAFTALGGLGKAEAETLSRTDAVYPPPNTQRTNGSTVYFTRDITSSGLVKIYQALGQGPASGDKVAVKISTGEPPHSNYLRPELIGDLVRLLNADIVECNTAYSGQRHTTASHYKVAKAHGYTAIATVKILDENGETDIPVKGVPNAHLKFHRVGSELTDYDFLVNLAHFKGHGMAGFGGVIKNCAIGLGSPSGKVYVHSAGTKTSGGIFYNDQNAWLEGLAEATKAVHDYFGNGKKVVYIDVMNRLSVDCDCVGNPAKPEMDDIGICASLDPVAVDKACIDMVWAAERTATSSNAALEKRIRDRNGYQTLIYAEQIGLGSQNYEIVNI
jgi:uncharacterized Fe-S center protein